jgi:hypothetical protein
VVRLPEPGVVADLPFAEKRSRKLTRNETVALEISHERHALSARSLVGNLPATSLLH